MNKHKAIPQGYMTVGEVAKKMDVTVRTLQHYDREGFHLINQMKLLILYRSTFILCNYGRYIYVSYAGSEIYAYSVNDCIWRDNGSVNWSAPIAC